MAHYAFVDNDGVVFEVITGRDETETVDGISDWESHYSSLRENAQAIRTSYNTRGGVHYDPVSGQPSADQSKALRFNYAGIGFTYDAKRDAFISPKPFESWVLDEATCLWVAPVPYPEDGKDYSWAEDTVSWVEVPAE